MKIDFSRLPIPEKIQKAYAILDAMEGNPHFPAPEPGLEDLREAVLRLEDAYMEARYGDRLKRAVMVIVEQRLSVLISSLGGYVQSISKGDLETTLSSGFGVYKARCATQRVDAPVNVRVKVGRKEGEVFVRWDPVAGARSYTPQISTDNGETWVDCPTITRSRMYVDGLVSGSRPWFRVSAYGIQGHSGWSNAAWVKVY